MNPEAVEWLENLTDEERGDWFRMCNHFGYGPDGLGLFSLKADHERAALNGRCFECRYTENLIVVG